MFCTNVPHAHSALIKTRPQLQMYLSENALYDWAEFGRQNSVGKGEDEVKKDKMSSLTPFDPFPCLMLDCKKPGTRPHGHL